MSRAQTSCRLACMLVATVVAGPAFAQSVNVSAQLSERTVAVGDVVTLEIRAVTNASGDIQIAVPANDYLSELNRSQSESSSWSFTGAGKQVRREKVMRVDFEATTPGTFSLNDITAQVGRSKSKAGAVAITIVKSAAVVATTPTPGQVAPPTPEEGQLFVRYRINKATAYLGEQLVLDLDIFTNASFNLDNSKGPPALDGFWREIIEQPNRLQGTVVNIAGRQWRRYRLWRMAIFPLQAGTKTIPKNPLTFSVNRGMFSTGNRTKRTAPPIKIEVLPLPTEGRPANFASTNVGHFQFNAHVDRQRVPAGKAVVLRMTLSGAGNIKSVVMPALPRLDGFRAFPPTLKDTVNKTANGLSGVKTAEIILMPLKGGRLVIPRLSIGTFNPLLKKYVPLTTRAIPIFVDGDPSAAPSAPDLPQAAGGDDTPVKKADLAPLRFRSNLENHNPPLAVQPLFAAFMIAPPFLFFLMLLGELGLSRMRKQSPDAKRKQAAKEAHARLARAQEAAEKGDSTRVYAEINDTLIDFASEKSGVAVRGLTMDETRVALSNKGAPAELIDALVAELEHCDFARFAPGGTEEKTVREALSRASDVLTNLEAWEVAK